MSVTKAKSRAISTVLSLSQVAEAIYGDFRAEKKKQAQGKKNFRVVPALFGAPGQGKSSLIEHDVLNRFNEDRKKFIENHVSKATEAHREAELEKVTKNPKYKPKTLSDETVLALRKEATEMKECPAEWVVLSFRLSQIDPTDLKGVPNYYSLDGMDYTTYSPPFSFPILGQPNSAKGKNVIVFLDELGQATQVIQNLGANIIDGNIGEHRIDPDRSFIIVASNRKSDKSASFDIPRNVVNRIAMYTVNTEFSEWKEWAINNKVNPIVIGYLESRTSEFNEPVPEIQGPYATPRSWDKVSAIVDDFTENNALDDQTLLSCRIEANVGASKTYAFMSFYKSVANDYAIDKIFSGKLKDIPKSNDIIFSLILEGNYRIDSWFQKIHNSNEIQMCTNPTERNDLALKALTTEQISAINNFYEYFSQDKIDAAFRVLLNKYQREETIQYLRPALLKAKDPSNQLHKAHKAYMTLLAILR